MTIMLYNSGSQSGDNPGSLTKINKNDNNKFNVWSFVYLLFLLWSWGDLYYDTILLAAENHTVRERTHEMRVTWGSELNTMASEDNKIFSTS